MPSITRLVAALCLAGMAAVLSGMIAPLFDSGFRKAPFFAVNIAIGLMVGWQVLGPRAGLGWRGALGNGLGGGALVMFWALFVHAVLLMARRAMAHWYAGPSDALIAIFDLMLGFAQVIARPDILAVFVLGSVLSGLVCAYTKAKWP